jgi:sRNA-binding regulator protein Hfq
MDVRRQANDNAYADVPAAVRPSAVGGGVLSKVVAVALVLAALAVVGWLASKALASFTADAGVHSKQYQAVFLTNGQVYFGKVKSVDNSYVKVTDIYYLQVQQQVQPKDATATQTPQVSLAKLGGELHGPEDVMYVSRAQVLFWENLKDDGKVTKAIKDYKAGGAK